MGEQNHKYFFGNHPQMPWKKETDYWGLRAKEGVEGWEPGERRYVLMDEYQELIRKYPDNWEYEGIKHASEK
jgi:hypothetical protein